MKKVLFFIMLSLFCSPFGKVYAQPMRLWSTYYGQYAQYSQYYNLSLTQGTIIFDIKFDKKRNNVYVLGSTTDTSGIASAGSFKDFFHSRPLGTSQTTYLYGRNYFLVKFDTAGHRLWATYFGGNRDVTMPTMVIDNSGNIYLSGATNSDSGLATSGSFKSVYTGSLDLNNQSLCSYLAFLAKFNSQGQRLWATYYGQHSTWSSAIAYDSVTNSVYIAGQTTDSSGIATPGCFKEHYVYHNPDYFDAFIARFDTAGALKWSTYYGGGKSDGIRSLWIGSQGNLYALGSSLSYQNIATPKSDVDSSDYGAGFLVKFDSSGHRDWGTYVLHSASVAFPFTVIGFSTSDGIDNVYVAGQIADASNTDISLNAYQSAYGGGIFDLVFVKYNQDGQRKWTTYFGGNGEEPMGYLLDYAFSISLGPRSLAVDEKGDIYMVSPTNSTQGIEKSCSPAASNNNHSIIAKWNASGYLLWSRYYDGILYAVSEEQPGYFYVGGYTTLDSLATQGAFQYAKVPNRPSGIFARFSDNLNCPDIQISIQAIQNQLSVPDSFVFYQWFYNGQLLSDEHYSSYQIPNADSGQYYVVASDSCGCSFTSDTINYPTTGIAKVTENGMRLHSFPNPFTNSITISGIFSKPIVSELHWMMTDITGRLIDQGYFRAQGHQFSEKIYLKNAANGVYFLKVKGKHVFGVLKIVRTE